jgi:DNA-directed RNA polymerase subunit M/transcription elongation factor TFIIS
MFVFCPHCHANYEIETAGDDTVLLCNRCGVEFSIADQAGSPNEQKPGENQENSSNKTSDTAGSVEAGISGLEEACMPEDSGVETESEAEIIRPGRRKVRIWPWLMIMLTLIFSAGFWLQKDAWLDNRWFRSTAINLGITIHQRDKDWRVIPDSIQAEWIIRDDASKALLIRGRVKNLLTSELPAPSIEVTFYSDLYPDKELGSQHLNITLQPGKQSLLRVPYTAPKPDTIPVTPEGERKFTFLIESPPENSGDFTLTARAQ